MVAASAAYPRTRRGPGGRCEMMPIVRLAVPMFLAAAMLTGCAHQDRQVNRDDPVPDEPRPAMPEEAPDHEPTPLHEISEEELELALDRAITAAVAAEGGSYCERSYNAMIAMRDSLVADLGEAAAHDLPSKERFVEACEQLPMEAQRCMDVAYAMENQAECQRVMEEVPLEQRRALEDVLQNP